MGHKADINFLKNYPQSYGVPGLIHSEEAGKIYFGLIHRNQDKSVHMIRDVQEFTVEDGLKVVKNVDPFTFDKSEFDIYRGKKEFLWAMNKLGIQWEMPSSKPKKPQNSFYDSLSNLKIGDLIGVYDEASSSFYLGDLKNPRRDITRNNARRITLVDTLQVGLRPAGSNEVVEWKGYQFSNNGTTYNGIKYIPLSWNRKTKILETPKKVKKELNKHNKNHDLGHIIEVIEELERRI